MDLGGTWRAAPADEDLRRVFAERDHDDAGWESLTVPGHWHEHPAFTRATAVLHRREFESTPPLEDERVWLVFDGVFYQGDVWLDGSYLGDTEGYFIRHTFEITDAVEAASEHVLAVEVTCGTNRDRNLTGCFQREGAPHPGGIWRGVRIERTGPVRARSLRVLCTEATADRAVVQLRAELDSNAARAVLLRTTVGEHDEVAERPIAEGSNFVEWTVTVPRPPLWWPHALGDQPLQDLHVEVTAETGVSHRVHRRVGLRRITSKRWVLSVNGERLFLKGVEVLARLQGEEHDIEAARAAGADLVRLNGHVAVPDVYKAADRLGLLIWQDLPMVGRVARGVRKQATRQATAAVDLVGHHPAVAIWSGHVDPRLLDRFLVDRSVRRALQKADASRPVVASDAAATDGFDPGLARLIPRTARFVTDLGPADGLEARAARLRRLKYRPAGGFCHPDAAAAAPALAPVVVATDPLPESVSPGEPLVLDVHAVNDGRAPVIDARVHAELRWAGGSHDWQWTGDIPADGVTRVGTIQALVPATEGTLTLTVHLEAGDHRSSLEESCTVSAPARREG